VALTWLELWNSPSGNQVPPQQAQAQNTSQSDSGSPSKQPESISFWQRTVRDPINLFTGVLAITIILAAASIYQGWQTQQSVKSPRER
jgi:hypothetical protein